MAADKPRALGPNLGLRAKGDGQQNQQTCVLDTSRTVWLCSRPWKRVNYRCTDRQKRVLLTNCSRSASGFTTRSDIGPAREGPSAEVIA